MKIKLLAMALLLLPVVASASEIETVVDNLKYVINTDEETAIKSIDRDGASEMLRFTLDGRRINSPQKGLNIIKTRDGRTRKVVVK